MAYIWTDSTIVRNKTLIKREHIVELRNAADDLDTRLTAHVGSRGVSHGVATQALSGFMSAVDKTAFDNHLLTNNFSAHSVATDNNNGFLSKEDFTLLHNHIGARDAVHGLADATHHGFMSSSAYNLLYNHVGSNPATAHIGAALNLYISPTGNDTTGNGLTTGTAWATIHAAMTYLSTKVVRVLRNARVNIIFMDGIHTYNTSPYTDVSLDSCNIVIKGQNAYSKTISNVYSTSGSTGNWSVTLTLNSTTNVVVGDYAIITSASGGSNPMYVVGCHRVTNVSGGRITLNIKSHTPEPPTGAVTGTVRIIKAILSYPNSSGVQTEPTLAYRFEDLVHVGGSSGAGFVASSGSVGLFNVGVTGFNTGILAIDNSYVYCSGTAVSNCGGNGYAAQHGGMIRCDDTAASGCGNDGYEALQGGVISTEDGISVAAGNETGFCCWHGGIGNYAHSTSTGNTLDGYDCAYGSMMYAYNTTATNNSEEGYYAGCNAQITVYGGARSGNGTDFSPALGTEGNNGAYIWEEA